MPSFYEMKPVTGTHENDFSSTKGAGFQSAKVNGSTS